MDYKRFAVSIEHDPLDPIPPPKMKTTDRELVLGQSYTSTSSFTSRVIY